MSFSFVVDGPSSLTAVCNDSASSIDPSSSTDSSSVEASDAAAVRGGQSAKNTPGGRLLLDEANGTMFQTFCNNHNDGEGVLEARWRWGAGGATFALGELSRIRLASDALLDGLWSSVREAFSTVTEEGEITASVELFESRATFSTLLFYDDVATVEEGSSTDFGKGESRAEGTVVTVVDVREGSGSCFFEVGVDYSANYRRESGGRGGVMKETAYWKRGAASRQQISHPFP